MGNGYLQIRDRPTLPAELTSRDVLLSCTHRRKLAAAFTQHMTATRQQHLAMSNGIYQDNTFTRPPTSMTPTTSQTLNTAADNNTTTTNSAASGNKAVGGTYSCNSSSGAGCVSSNSSCSSVMTGGENCNNVLNDEVKSNIQKRLITSDSSQLVNASVSVPSSNPLEGKIEVLEIL